MNASFSLLKPSLKNIQSDFFQIFHELGFDSHPDRLALKRHIQVQLKQIEALLADVSELQAQTQILTPSAILDSIKNLKLDLRFAKRTLGRIQSNDIRVRKMHERRAHVATVAA